MTLLASILFAATFTRSLERVTSMDPMMSQAVYESKAVSLVYETPLEIDYEARPYRLAPGLCELPEVSEDGLEYVFRMVPGAKLGAADIIRSLERLRDPSLASPCGWTMKSVKSFAVREDGALVVTLKQRNHVFPWMLAKSSAGVRAEDGSGTGAYKLTHWRKNHEMVFERRKSLPGAFDSVRFLVVSDVSTQWLMFLRGELDFLGEISRDNWDAVVSGDGQLDPSLVAEGVSLHSWPTLDVNYIGINMDDPVLGTNKKLRQALNCAFNFEIWKRFYNNRIDPADGPVPVAVEGHLDEPPRYAYNIERAKQLLAEAGYPGGIDAKTGRRLTLTLSIGRATQDARESGELLASFFDKIGIKLELSFSTWGTFLRSVNEGLVQMYMMGWVGDYPDAENFLQLFYSANRSPGPNHSNYSNAEFDAEYEAAMASATAEQRNAHWRRCQEIVREDCPWIFTHFPKAYALVRPRVGNYIPSVFPYGQEKHLKVRSPLSEAIGNRQ